MTIDYKIDINQYIKFILLLGGYTIKFNFFKQWRKKNATQSLSFSMDFLFFFFSNNNNNNDNKIIIEEIWCVADMAESGP